MIGYLDCSTGVSGDKFLGALLDAGQDATSSGGASFTLEDLVAVAAAIAPEAHVSAERVRSHGVDAVQVRVSGAATSPSRTWADIERLLASAPLGEPVRRNSLRVFEALADAEAHAHAVPVEEVHFHEVGALDSIVDIVGTCAGLAALGVERLFVSRVALGGGVVETSHGPLPVPAPATRILVEGMPVLAGPVETELTTPTGAALVRMLAAFAPAPTMRLARQGCGSGTRDIGRPNVCCLLLGEPVDPAADEGVVVLETNLDHLSAEEVAHVAEQLRGARGVLDVWQQSVAMKKGRMGILLSALVREGEETLAARQLIELSGTLGVRRMPASRYVAQRRVATIESEWGPVRVKIGAGRIRPEHDDVARIARERGLAYERVRDELTARAHEQLAPDEPGSDGDS